MKTAWFIVRGLALPHRSVGRPCRASPPSLRSAFQSPVGGAASSQPGRSRALPGRHRQDPRDPQDPNMANRPGLPSDLVTWTPGTPIGMRPKLCASPDRAHASASDDARHGDDGERLLSCGRPCRDRSGPVPRCPAVIGADRPQPCTDRGLSRPLWPPAGPHAGTGEPGTTVCGRGAFPLARAALRRWVAFTEGGEAAISA